MATNTIKRRTSKNWELKQIQITHNVVEYNRYEKVVSRNDTDAVRLHFGLSGHYEFNCTQLAGNFDLFGHHNNIMYSKGLDLEVFNKSDRIETFGVNFSRESFIEIGQNGNDTLKRFTEKVIEEKNAMLSKNWKANNFKIQEVINEIIHCSYTNELQDLFLLSKSIELLVLQADLYGQKNTHQFIKLEKDKRALIEAKELLDSRIDHPPTLVELSKLIGLNEYKLKKGFKELFGTTVFGYIHNCRMALAKQLLLETDKTAKEIAYETGYSSPQHFSNAFKKKYGLTPKSVRKNPDSTMKGKGRL